MSPFASSEPFAPFTPVDNFIPCHTICCGLKCIHTTTYSVAVYEWGMEDARFMNVWLKQDNPLDSGLSFIFAKFYQNWRSARPSAKNYFNVYEYVSIIFCLQDFASHPIWVKFYPLFLCPFIHFNFFRRRRIRLRRKNILALCLNFLQRHLFLPRTHRLFQMLSGNT